MTEEINVDHIQKKPTFVVDYLSYLPEVLQKELLSKFVQVELDQFKIVDDTLYDLAMNRLISNASGTYLDDIGVRFQIYRNGLDDDSYRTVLFLRTGEAQKHGTRPEIIVILRKLLGSESVLTYKGHNYRFDIAISSPCFDSNSTAADIANILPLITDFRLVEGLGVPFGFDGDNTVGGFGSISTGIYFDIGSVGSFYSVKYQSKPDL